MRSFSNSSCCRCGKNLPNALLNTPVLRRAAVNLESDCDVGRGEASVPKYGGERLMSS